MTGLLLSVTDEVQNALQNERVATMVTFDIKGAFDSVRPNRMVDRLITQGWPTHTCRWAGSFLSDRTATMSLGGFSSEDEPLGGSLPQGSPISPILFMLFMSPLYAKLAEARGYADDGCLVKTGWNLEQTTEGAEEDLQVA
ncbi:uncharacterized protein BROUX77_001708 [Berkeleyomyces rouxiae]|uniref:uncharacterized protein n=1 Tax=Berkeleyomyces rouxiae TaxID=2035830 RepID=UPI003B7C5FB4